MKRFGLWLAVLLSLCLAVMPMAVAAAPAPISWMPASEDNYTIVEGDGTVSLDGGIMTITNNGDGDLRVLIVNETPLDMTANNALHMQFDAQMPFKMAWHIVSLVDDTNDWVTTSTEYPDLLPLDAATDRAAVGEYDVTMNIGADSVDLADKSSVYFEQFILLMTGKGTFTLNTVEMVYVESDEPAEEVPADDDAASEDSAEDSEPADDDTLTIGADEDNKDDKDDKAGVPVWVFIAGGVAVLFIAAIAVIVVKKKK